MPAFAALCSLLSASSSVSLLAPTDIHRRALVERQRGGWAAHPQPGPRVIDAVAKKDEIEHGGFNI
jgi:hypothetical protein